MPSVTVQNWMTFVHITALMLPRVVYRVVNNPINRIHSQTGSPVTKLITKGGA